MSQVNPKTTPARVKVLKPSLPGGKGRWRRGLERMLAATVIVGLAVVVSSCGTVGYVTQSAWGGLRLMSKREPIDRLAAGRPFGRCRAQGAP